jgi:hypothetical protein
MSGSLPTCLAFSSLSKSKTCFFICLTYAYSIFNLYSIRFFEEEAPNDQFLAPFIGGGGPRNNPKPSNIH